ncbi:MAG: hypothetical protein ACJ759_12730 [Thermoanaerobaculia bacterium]
MSPADAVRRALRLLALPESGNGTAHRVRRLDGQGLVYFLIFVPGHVALLDERTGELLASAETARSPLTLTEGEALSRAGLGPDARAELVWKPCRASLSMFDPLWAVTSRGRTVYVDQRGRVMEELEPKRPGGGAGA